MYDLPSGIVIGLADDITKVKGVLLAASAIEEVVRGMEGLGGEYEVVVERTGDRESITLKMGADYFIPKEEMTRLPTFLRDIFESRARGKSPWIKWYGRPASFCEKRFGPDWKSKDKAFWDRLTFH